MLNAPIEERTNDRMALLGQFSAGLVHDLRTPLTVICNVVNVLRRQAPPTAEVTECLDMIDDEVQRLNRTLTDLVEIAHGHELHREEVDLEPLLSQTAQRVDENHRLEWTFELRFKPAVVWCDRARFQQVLDKLLRNAFKAMKGQGKVHVLAWRDDDGDVVEVRDGGPGVPDEVRATLFEPFVSTRKTGMGLGLTYCREIMKRHGGSIRLVESSPAGAAFRVVLPRKNTPRIASP